MFWSFCELALLHSILGPSIEMFVNVKSRQVSEPWQICLIIKILGAIYQASSITFHNFHFHFITFYSISLLHIESEFKRFIEQNVMKCNLNIEIQEKMYQKLWNMIECWRDVWAKSTLNSWDSKWCSRVAFRKKIKIKLNQI